MEQGRRMNSHNCRAAQTRDPGQTADTQLDRGRSLNGRLGSKTEQITD